MLKNYRPGQVSKSDYRRHYVEIVRSDGQRKGFFIKEFKLTPVN